MITVLTLNTSPPKPKLAENFSAFMLELSSCSQSFYFNSNVDLPNQNEIQEKSYLFLDQAFSLSDSEEIKNNIKLLMSKIDLNEIKTNLVDLSTPEVNEGYSNQLSASKLYDENQNFLHYLSSPIEGLNDDSFSDQINGLFEEKQSLNETIFTQKVKFFLDNNKKIIEEVILFSKALNLIILSQSFYIFCFHFKKSLNLAKVLEILLYYKPEFNNDIEVKNLAKRFISIYVNYISINVFNTYSLQRIEEAFGEL